VLAFKLKVKKIIKNKNNYFFLSKIVYKLAIRVNVDLMQSNHVIRKEKEQNTNFKIGRDNQKSAIHESNMKKLS
jgi:hypothetical protein